MNMKIETRLTTACIFGYGFVHTIPRVLIWMAAEDIVSGTLIQSSFAITLFSLGDILMRIGATVMFKKTSFIPLVILLGIVGVTAYLLLVAVDQVKLRLCGAFFAGAEIALTDVILMFIIARCRHSEEFTSAYQVGVNTMTLFFALLYTGSTIWLCLPPRLTVAIIYPVTAVVFIFYGILNHGSLKKYQIQPVEQEGPRYKPVSSGEETSTRKQSSRWIECLQFIFDVFPFFGYYFTSYCCFYLTSTSVLTTLTIPSSPFRIRDHYHYYKLSTDVGLVLGGMEVMLVSCLCSNWMNTLRIRRIWILVLVNFGLLMFFLFAAWYHFVHNVFILLVLCGTQGFIFGSTAVHVLVAVVDKFDSLSAKGFALNIAQSGCSLGRLFSGLLGIFVEEYLRTHCTNNLLMGQYCLARFSSPTGWNDNFQCS